MLGLQLQLCALRACHVCCLQSANAGVALKSSHLTSLQRLKPDIRDDCSRVRLGRNPPMCGRCLKLLKPHNILNPKSPPKLPDPQRALMGMGEVSVLAGCVGKYFRIGLPGDNHKPA